MIDTEHLTTQEVIDQIDRWEEQDRQRLNGKAKEKKPRIRLIPFEDIKLSTQRRDLIKGLFPRVGITVVWGPPKCGKSFWVFDAVMHVALNLRYRGRRVHPGAVVYCAFEGQSGFEARAEAFRQRFLEPTERVPFHLMPATLNLVKDHKALIDAIAAVYGEENPVCVVLDTLNRSLEGSESKDEDMSAIFGPPTQSAKNSIVR
jgi:RecA-family ATPase